MEKPSILVFVSSEKCLHCKNFIRSELPKLKLNLNQIPNIQYLDTDIVTNPKYEGYPRGIIDYVSWVPTFLLFTVESWTGDDGILTGVALNGIKDAKGKIQRIAGKVIDITADNITNWVRDTMKHNRLFLNNKIINPKSTPQNPIIGIINNSVDKIFVNKTLYI